MIIKIKKMKNIYKILSQLKQRGFKKSILAAYSLLYDLYYDAKHGFDTYSWVPVNELDVEEFQKEHAVIYQATRVLPLRRLFKKLNIPKDYSFIDIGCGKGRVLLIAAEYGFEEVKGIEFSSNLTAIANKNISKYKIQTNSSTFFDVINVDATDYKFNNIEDVFFLFNPFDEVVLKKVLDNINESLKKDNRRVWMIYANAIHRDLIEKTMKIVSVEDFNILEFDFVVYQVEPRSKYKKNR